MRWRLSEDDEGQGALFEEEVERHIGKGEFRGMEFLHVNARTIINEIPKASMLPFRWTINAYRGCSHACRYCADGDTEILLANGRNRAIAELSVGDEIYGTRRGRLRRTHVLDHWSTTKPAYDLRTDDGAHLVTSGDHRLLTSAGWRAVATLGPGHQLVAPGRFVDVFRSYTRENVHKATVAVASVEPTDEELALYDITTGT